MPVEVVGGDVQQNRRLGGERECVLELKRGSLADDGHIRSDRSHETAERGADVPGDRDRQAGGPVDVPDQLHRGGLAVRARHGHELVLQQAPGELQLAEHGHPARVGRGDDRRLPGHARTLDDGTDMPQQRHTVLMQVQLDAGVREHPQALGARLRRRRSPARRARAVRARPPAPSGRARRSGRDRWRCLVWCARSPQRMLW